MKPAGRKGSKRIDGGGNSLADTPARGDPTARLAGGYGPHALGVAVSRVAAPIVAKRGGGLLARLKSEWRMILGAEWAARSWPTALSRDGVLTLRIDSAAAALDLQHRTPLAIERINLYLGRAAIGRLKLVQGPLPLPPASNPPARRVLDPGAAEALAKQLSDVAEPELRAALARLGRAILAEPEPGAEGGVAPKDDPD